MAWWYICGQVHYWLLYVWCAIGLMCISCGSWLFWHCKDINNFMLLFKSHHMIIASFLFIHHNMASVHFYGTSQMMDCILLLVIGINLLLHLFVWVVDLLFILSHHFIYLCWQVEWCDEVNSSMWLMQPGPYNNDIFVFKDVYNLMWLMSQYPSNNNVSQVFADPSRSRSCHGEISLILHLLV